MLVGVSSLVNKRFGVVAASRAQGTLQGWTTLLSYWTLCTLMCAQLYTIYSVHYMMCSVFSAQGSVHLTGQFTIMCNVHHTVCIVHSTFSHLIYHVQWVTCAVDGD